MPLICHYYASISPWNVRRVKFGDYQRLCLYAKEMSKTRQ